jgi:hypothetical protein
MTPGRMYYLEWTAPACNTWLMNEDLPGEAYRDGKPLPKSDLVLTIVEYGGRATATRPEGERR